ncbi:MAG: hypothetical protein KJ630_05190 [Proteobacteria bacterium]|nr:hypothetical protein [Pseudomonadota bacterium]
MRSEEPKDSPPTSLRYVGDLPVSFHEIWEMTWQWAKRRHPKKMLKWIKFKYFQSIGTRRWVFREKDDPISLLKLSDIPIRRHIKIKANANPYDPEWYEYFIERSQRLLSGA